MATRQIIVLEQTAPNPNTARFRAVFWLSVLPSRQAMFANATAKSAVVDGSVTVDESTALQTGAVHELVQSFSYPAGTSLANIQADLLSQYTSTQTAFTAQTGDFADRVLTRYGSFYDGAWTLKNNIA